MYNVTDGIRVAIEEITSKSSSSVPTTQSFSQTPLSTNLPGESQKTKEKLVSEGVISMYFKNYSEALLAFEQALRIDPNFALAYSNKAAALIGLHRYQEALTACEQAISLDPNNALFHSTKGAALNELKRYREALAASERAISLDPNSGAAYNNKGKALDGLNRRKEAEQAYAKARLLGDFSIY